MIGDTAYTSSFETGKTVGLDVHTHKKTFEIKQAGYTPIVSDGVRLFLVGYYALGGTGAEREVGRWRVTLG